MSYYTRFEITWDDGDRAKGDITEDQIVAAARTFVLENDWSEDVLSDLRDALRGFGEPGIANLPSYFIEQMAVYISKSIPDVTFYARAMGEEFADVWIREIRDGEVALARGPFDVEGDSSAA